ncbi:hypothetical protein [Halobellus litoreus]|uniref:Uncharacterized protein n=1 Tax=Halobellus litoreus TaxID=755310 RepID=A0ABD6DZ47_9EURY|nr:hypothetical protein [Halobellus litoreus]
MSAETHPGAHSQNPVWRNPTSAAAAALFRLPATVDVREAGRWAIAARDADDSARVLAWLERAKREGAIVLEGSE